MLQLNSVVLAHVTFACEHHIACNKYQAKSMSSALQVGFVITPALVSDKSADQHSTCSRLDN